MALRELPRSSQLRALVIRHAERRKFASELGVLVQDTNEDDVPITEEGRASATECGILLKPTIGRVFTSPVRRCVSTADCIAKGAGLPSHSVHVQDFLSSTFFGLLNHVDEQAKQDTVRMLLTGRPDSITIEGLDLLRSGGNR